MGISLRKKPLMDYETEMGANSFYKFGASRVTGWRKSQEDRLICLPDFHKDLSLFAVFDGHGGSEVADYLIQNLPRHLAAFLENNDCEIALQLAFLTSDNCLRIMSDKYKPSDDASEDDLMDDLPSREAVLPALKAILSNADSAGTSQEGTESMPDSLRKTIASETLKFLTSADLEPEDSDEDDENYDESMESSASEDSDSNQSEDHDSGTENQHGKDIPDEDIPESKLDFCGSTGTVVLFNQEKAFIANVGDSRCIASVKGKAVELSVDHKPTDEEEQIRIKNAGSKVTDDGRIDGGLNMSRAFGDFDVKKSDDIEQAIICDPHIATIDVNEELDFIVVASDGIWNSLSNQEVVDYVNIRIKDTQLSDICEELFEFILAPDPYGDGTGCDNMSMAIIEFSKKSESIMNFHICCNDMELDEDNSEMESHGSADSADKSAGMKMLDGNTENKDSSRCSNNGVGEKNNAVLFEDVVTKVKHSIHALVVNKYPKTLHSFSCNLMHEPLFVNPLTDEEEQQNLEIDIALNSEEYDILECSDSTISEAILNQDMYEISVRAPHYNVQSILYENNHSTSYKMI